MAIKGKKKSQSRGSQGQRRPAAAPRPVYTGRKHTPWYKTNEGRLVGGMLIAVVIGVGIWLVMDAQNKSKEQTERREALEAYVSSARSFATSLGPVAEDMLLVDPANPDLEALAEDSKKWTEDLTAAQAQAATLQPPEGADVANGLFLQALSSYLSASRTYESVDRADGELQTELLAQAAEEREQGAALFGLAVDALDEELIEVEGDLSNLSIPDAMPQPPAGEVPVEGSESEIQIPVGGDNGGGGGGGQGGGGQGGGGQGGGGAGNGGGGAGGGGQGDGN